MVIAEAGSTQPRWKLCDGLAAAGLFLATAGAILWQNAHIAVLWDLSYILDSASRIARGQLPYRDFPFVHAPLTFLVQAAIIRLTGRVFFHHVLYAATVGGLGAVLAWRITFHMLRGRVESAWITALLLAAPLTVLGIYCIMPLPNYDCDCVFSILVAAWLLQRLDPVVGADSPPRNSALLWALATGAALCLPLFFKQNIGLPFLVVSIGAILLLLGLEFLTRRKFPLEARDRPDVLKGHGFSRAATNSKSTRALAPEVRWPGHQTPNLLAVLASSSVTLLAAALILHFTAGLNSYIHWTIQFAAQRRLPGLADMLGVYRDPQLLWMLPCLVAGIVLLRSRLAKARWAQIAALVFLAAPFVYTLSSLFLYDDADERGDSLLALWPMLLVLATAMALFNLVKLLRRLTLRAFLPLILLAAINGAFMSQQLWGSTYATWPLLILLIADMLAFLARPTPSPATSSALQRNPTLAIATVLSATLLTCGAFYTSSEERLSYAQFPDGPVEHSNFPQLSGISTPGPWLPDFDELLRYAAANIPASDGILLLPGEDPFYFATGRAPQFPVLLFDPATDPYSPAQVLEEARLHQIRWLIVKRNLQIKIDSTPNREATLSALYADFALATRLRAYDVYHR